MSAVCSSSQFNTDKAFFGNAYQRGRNRDSGQDAVTNDAPFVEHHFQLNAATFEQGGDRFCATITADFFIVSVRYVDGSTRAEAFTQQHLDSLHHPDHRGLIVDGAASPYEAVGDPAAEGRLLPFSLGAGLDWNYVQV